MGDEISDHERAYFKKMFDLFDTDKSGAIGLAELRNLSRHLGVEMSDDAILESVRSIGSPVSAKGEIDLPFQDFLKWLQKAQASGDEFALLKAKIKAGGSKTLNNEQIARLKEVFENFDADGSGSIDAEELGNVFRSMGEEVDPEELKSMIEGVDDDGSGQIEFNEFMLLMCSNFGGHTFEEDMRKVFEEADPEDTGLVSPETLFRIMKDSTGGSIPDREIWEIINSVERKDGMVEWMKWEALWEACNEE
jgi:calcium-binding protein CML